MTADEFDSWLATAIPDYAADKVASGQWSAEESLERSLKAHEELLPQGLQTEKNHFLAVTDSDGLFVGMIWFAIEAKFGLPTAYVYNVLIHQEHRRKGYALQALSALEKEIVALGLNGIALHVFGHNAAARALYEKLGYEPTNINLFKHVPPGTHPTPDASPDRGHRGPELKRTWISSGSSFEAEIAYSRAVVQGEWIFVSGTTGFDYATMSISADVAEQAEQCLKNIAAALAQADSGMADIVRVTYVLPVASDFQMCWPILRKYFGTVRPAAMMISAGLLDPRMKIEMEVTALRRAG